MEIMQDVVPSTIKAAVAQLEHVLSDNQRNFILSNNDASDWTLMHFGVGTSLRNSWSLWDPDTPLKRDAVRTYGIAHADDISGLIIAWLWAVVRGEPFDPLEHCQRYHRHWKHMGMTSLAAGGWRDDGSAPIQETCNQQRKGDERER